MSAIFENASVQRVQALMKELGISGEITALADSARTAKEAADALGIEVGQVASSIVFKLDDESPLLVITSGRHKVDTDLVAKNLGQSKLHRVDADYVKEKSGFSIGGVSPLAWISKPEITIIDQALGDYDVVWAAAGHPHSVFPTTYAELITSTGATPMVVGE
jgi:prolyl-tRNA editing enzyme YbaK/EbsC (Cys-tRNA(Pro) deacylase)